MLETFLQIVAPHHCYGCNKTGATLCDNCKYNIVDDQFEGCIVCRRVVERHGVCGSCHTSYEQAWIVTERRDEVQKALDGYKFDRQRALAKVFADLLDLRLPEFSGIDVVVVPVPTISSHVRRRGYDHAALIAREFAKRRNLPYSSILGRKTNTVQLGASRRERLANAKNTFEVKRKPTPDKTYLLVDDVVTTGATLQFGAKSLRDAGALAVWAAAIARQPLDKVV